MVNLEKIFIIDKLLEEINKMELAVDYRFCIINLKRKNMKKEKEKNHYLPIAG